MAGLRNLVDTLLGAFAKLRKATVRFAMFVCLSVRPLGITLPSLDRFS
jgi:hypothetical protein